MPKPSRNRGNEAEPEPEPFPIPFNRPTLTGKEFDYVREAIQAAHFSGDGPFTHRCQRYLRETLGVPQVLLTPSCTHALEMAALLLDVGPSDEVIVPSFTFVSTANAFALRGARIVFADIHPDTLNLDERHLEVLVTPVTRVIVPVHYSGIGCEMDAILEIAERRGVKVVEDNAHGLFGKYRGRHLGTFGCMATLSFHETKNFSCGEGGALLVNDPSFAERAEIIREKGTDRCRFFRGEVDKYTWVDLGSSYLLSDILAGFLYAQLECRDEILAKRRRVWEYYDRHLRKWAKTSGVRLPVTPEHCEPSYHMFYMLMPSLKSRQALIARLRSRGIYAVFHYVPLHLSKMGRSFGASPADCPVATDVSERLIRLPFYSDLPEPDQQRVVEEVLAFRV